MNNVLHDKVKQTVDSKGKIIIGISGICEFF